MLLHESDRLHWFALPLLPFVAVIYCYKELIFFSGASRFFLKCLILAGMTKLAASIHLTPP
jgi:hypothetical protein